MSRKWFFNCLFICLVISVATMGFVHAQIEQPDRFEIELVDSEYEVVSAGADGVFLIVSSVDYGNLEKSWEVIKLDTDFNLEWQRSYTVTTKQTLAAKYYENSKLYFLFVRTEIKNRNLELISFDQNNGFAESQIVKNFIPLAISDFKVINSSVVIGGYFNSRPLAILYNLLEGIPIVLPGLFGDRAELVQILPNDNKTFDITLTGRDFNKNTTIFLNTYDLDGALINSQTIKTEPKKDLLFGMLTHSDDEDKLIAGIYGRGFSEYSKGIFMANINKEGEQKLNYYNYADLKNFFNYMKAKREQRVRNRIERRKITGKKLRFNYRLMVHNISNIDDQVILTGEAFYPKYRTVGTNYSGNGRIVGSFNNGFIQSNRIFEGYQYTHAVVIGFSKEGKLLWDNSFEINDVLSFDLKQLVQVSVNKNRIALLYVYGSSIRSKVISQSKVLNDKELTPIKLKYESDMVDENATKIDGLESWYGDVFYTFGTQKIKNLHNSGVELNREVFFINKVIYK